MNVGVWVRGAVCLESFLSPLRTKTLAKLYTADWNARHARNVPSALSEHTHTFFQKQVVLKEDFSLSE